MKSKFILILFFAFSIGQSVNSQSYYRFNYKSPDINDTVSYDAFFAIYDNGSGFVRVSYLSPVTNKKMLVNMDIQEQYAENKDGTIDTSKLVYEGLNPKFISGDSKINFIPVTYWFKINPENKTFEPQGVTASAKDTVNQNTFLLAWFINNQALADTAFVLNYFIQSDAFYQNRFGSKSKGGGILTEEEKKTRLLLLVVASTYDKKVGKSAVVDSRNAIKTFTDIADFLHIKSVIDSVYGDKYGKANVEKAINKLNAIQKPGDIVVFYYSGHGFTDSLKKDKNYPFLDLLDPRQKPRPRPEDSTLNIEDIYTRIKNKPGRFKLVISDCCNDKIIRLKIDTIRPQPVKKDFVTTKWKWSNVYNLFMKERLSLLLTSASKGEQALGEDTKGGVYTNALLTTLKTNLIGEDKPNPVWPQILAEAQKQTIIRIEKAKLPCPVAFQPNGTCHQTPPLPKVN